MTYDSITRGMTLKLKPERQLAYGMPSNTVTVLGKKDRKGYKIGHIFAAYIDYDSASGSARQMSGYFKPSDFSGAHD